MAREGACRPASIGQSGGAAAAPRDLSAKATSDGTTSVAPEARAPKAAPARTEPGRETAPKQVLETEVPSPTEAVLGEEELLSPTFELSHLTQPLPMGVATGPY